MVTGTILMWLVSNLLLLSTIIYNFIHPKVADKKNSIKLVTKYHSLAQSLS